MMYIRCNYYRTEKVIKKLQRLNNEFNISI